MQLITTSQDFASQLLKRVYRVYPLQKIRDLIKNFRITPSITLNPATNEIDVSYKTLTLSSEHTAVEDVLNLIESLGASKAKPVVILDEFQEIKRIGKNTDRILRSIMQHHQNINSHFSIALQGRNEVTEDCQRKEHPKKKYFTDYSSSNSTPLISRWGLNPSFNQ